jgi:Lrp/AsnC family transcriptional regulator, leucine-responsive regulatory protein
VLRFLDKKSEESTFVAKETEGSSLTGTDRRILRALQDDGRITNQEIARVVGLSPAACFERVKRLREQGVIQCYTALLDPVPLDVALMIFVEVLLDRTNHDVFAAFARHVQGVPQVMECHMVAGGFDYLLKVRVADMAAYRLFLGDILTAMPGVRETRTYAVLEEVKSSTKLPVGL